MQKVMVFQQNGSGERKISGIRIYGKEDIELLVFDIDEALPPVIDDGRAYLPEDLDCDLVLDYLKHQDLSHDLVSLCHEKGVPIISTGKKIASKWVHNPPT